MAGKKDLPFDENWLERIDEHGYQDVRNGKLYWIEDDQDLWCKDMDYPTDPNLEWDISDA